VTNSPNQTIQRTASKPATNVLSVCHPRFGCVLRSAGLWRFDVFSSPVRNDRHGWLGPLIRGDKHSVDIRKTYNYQSDDLLYYRAFWPLGKIWILMKGL